MKRSQRATEEREFGSDSFLDVVANMVGILILLVLVVGLRASGATKTASEVNTAAMAEMNEIEKDARSVEHESLELVQEMARLQDLAEQHRYKRDTLITMVGLVNHDVDEFRKQLDARDREQFDLTRTLIEAKQRLEEADAQKRELAEASTSPTVTIKNYPTPISRAVHGKEVHFQLRGGRVTYVPLDELLDLLKTDARRSVERLADRDEVIETVGPIAGFRMRYTIGRVNIPVQAATAITSTGAQVVARASYAQLTEFNLLPQADNLGEPIETALQPASQFRMAMAGADPRTATVTLWTYPDSFESFRKLKEELYQLGFPVAGRPLPNGQLIGGSPNGTKSVAE